MAQPFYTGTWTDTFEVKKQSGALNNERIDEEKTVTIHVKRAEAEIESAVALRYSLPLSDNTYYTGSSAEGLLQAWAAQLASGYLMMRSFKGQGGSMYEDGESKVSDIRDQLKQLSGACDECPKISLIGTDGEELTTIDSGKSAITGFPSAESDTDEPSDNENAKFTMDMKY